MPLVKFHMAETVGDETRDAVCAAVQAALEETLDAPHEDLFQIVTRHRVDELKASEAWPGTAKRQQILYIEILMVRMYDSPTKARMFKAIADRVAACGIARQDIFVAVTENALDEWSAGTN
jgi:hypothetical protein